jgi:serpin B
MRRRWRTAALFVAVLVLLACQGSERPVAAPAKTSALDEPSEPPASVVPEPAEAAPADDGFHALLAKPAAGKPAGDVPAEVLAAAVERSNTASFALWRAFAHQGNFVVSPHSIRSALGLVYLASLPGEGRSSLSKGIGYPERNDDLDIRLLDGAVQASEEARFESANAVWVARQGALSPPYLDAVSRTLPAEVHSIDFAADPHRAQEMINGWVSDRTRGKIPEILRGSVIRPTTRATLVNAVYFFGKWRYPFDLELTAPKPFRTSHGTTIRTKMMAGARCDAAFEDDYQAAYADYGGSTSIVFVVVVPKRWQGFRWNAAAYQRVWASLDDSREAYLELPRFSLRSREEELSQALGKLGLRLGDPQLLAGLLASGEPLGIDAMVHEAFIQVDETSTEAAAATAITTTPVSDTRREPPPVFRVDRPFYFLLVERRTGLVTFMGQVTDPTA